MSANTTNIPQKDSIQVIHGEAPTIYIYKVDSGELERLTNASNPIPLAISGIAIGAFFSLLPTAISGLDELSSQNFGTSDLLYSIANAASLIIGLIASHFAIRNQKSVNKVLSQIKQRAAAK